MIITFSKTFPKSRGEKVPHYHPLRTPMASSII